MLLGGRKEGGLQKEACFLSKTLKVQEVEARAIEARCRRAVAGLLRDSTCEVWLYFPEEELWVQWQVLLYRDVTYVLYLVVRYISFGLFFQPLQVSFGFLPYQMTQPGVAKYILLYFQVRFKTVVIGSFWKKSWGNFPAFTADRCFFCLVRSPFTLWAVRSLTVHDVQG